MAINPKRPDPFAPDLSPEKNPTVFKTTFAGDFSRSVAPLLEASRLRKSISGAKRIILKPNLVEALPAPITTPVELVESIIDYILDASGDVEIIVADGTGSLEYDTFHCFEELGYIEMAMRRGVKLIDLNDEPSVELYSPLLKVWPSIFLPKILMDSFLISVPVLKAHTLAGVTLTMKNMIGVAPPAHYHTGGHWKKSAFHASMDESIFDLNAVRSPDFTVLDATVGMAEAHLWGRHCDPPPRIVAASYDPVALDAFGAGLLGFDWAGIGHIRMADGLLGQAGADVVVDVE